MRLTIETQQRQPGSVTVNLQGPLDGDTHRQLDREIRRLLTESVRVIVLDMGGVGDIVKCCG